MRTPRLLVAVVAILAVGILPAAAGTRVPQGNQPNPHGAKVRAGVGVTDATWHVGAGAGQYTAKDPNAGSLVTQGEIDPHNHSTAQRRSYGVQSRLTYRTLVVEGSNGKRIALVKTDSYLAQDMLTRRVGQILSQGDSGITTDQILVQASHNHSSPYYTTPGWGVWLFQDAFDARAYEYHARQMAASIQAAVADLRPARMGAKTVEHTIYKGNIVGGAIADDGTPAGYPDEHQDAGMTVVRFDDVSGPQPKPLAVYVNHGQHPESLDAYDLITADFLAPFERMVERDLGATLIFGQGDVGSAEGPYLRDNTEVMADGVYRAWAHVGHAQTERGARYLADSVIEAWKAIGRGEGDTPMSSDFVVDSLSSWVPGPLSHPYPSVSNCRSESTVEGNPGAPILGLPDCARGGSNDQTNMLWENLKAHGLPVPDHYDAPGFTAVEENARILLQVFRLGEVLLASCSCEAQMDLILNLESRLDDVEGNIFDGYDWSEHCTDNGDGTWTCPNPRNRSATLTVSDARYQRMRAQVRNDAAGWDAPENAVAANSEPSDPSKIWGNFTKEELPADLGYAVPVGVGHAGDYVGYTVSYREYMRGDHYRKALTSYGPHTADYMNTRLVRMAGALKGGPPVQPEPHDTALQADEARQEAMAQALGRVSSQAYDAWEAALPDDAGPVEAVTQPSAITRFDAATFTWRGGSNAVDNPVVRVERLVGKTWRPFADQSGEVQTMVQFPRGAAGAAATYAGATEWLWTANFEAFTAFPRRLGQTPEGTYRFVVDGHHRAGRKANPYHLTSEPFTVSPWGGVRADEVSVDGGGDVSFSAAATYPRTYSSPFRFIRDDGRTDVCKTCTFRPWASSAEVASAVVTVRRADGSVARVAAVRRDGRWTASTGLRAGDRAWIAPGDLRDANGEINAARIDLAG
ncbi:MAG TPA: neutral/alkaline non-lysosomal ceramidase N-terminal domain-containing protein [Egibacteraceae bacterium]|nr:neutral/alkaline non-lysosomal ceramidase N-terminal domain-containing protein [Egibacteraceae bacterium]